MGRGAARDGGGGRAGGSCGDAEPGATEPPESSATRRPARPRHSARPTDRGDRRTGAADEGHDGLADGAIEADGINVGAGVGWSPTGSGPRKTSAARIPTGDEDADEEAREDRDPGLHARRGYQYGRARA